MRRRRAAALAALALAAAGCSSGPESKRAAPLPASGPPNVVRVALADLLWPLEPARAKTRDELVVARMLFSTPLRTDVAGHLRPGLCTSWRQQGATWRLRCSHPGAIAWQLQRTQLLPTARVVVPNARTLVLRLPRRDPDVPYRLTQVAAAPPGVPGPFRLISASRDRVVGERRGLRVDVRRLEPFAALQLFRAGRLDEAPVPLGDIRATKLDPQLASAVRVRRLLGVDVVNFLPREVAPEISRVYDEAADRSDYQALISEFEAPPSEDLRNRGRPSAAKAAIALREARKRIPSLPKVTLPFAWPTDPALRYGTNLLIAAWRDLGLDPFVVADRGRAHAGLARLLAPYPKADSLRSDFDVVPIAWVADARLVSPRLRGWREDELGNVDYANVRIR